MDKRDYEYLKSAQLDPCKPQFTQDTMFSVARILIKEEVLYDTWDVLSFCERPDKWIGNVKRLLKQYEENL